MSRTIRFVMFVEAATFLVAASIHAGLLVAGYEHREARIAESVIALVLLAGAVLAWVRPTSARAVGPRGSGLRAARDEVGSSRW